MTAWRWLLNALRVLGALGVLITTSGLQAKEPLLIRHNFFDPKDPSQLNYRGEVLTLLLEKSKARYGPYVLQQKELPGWSQSRAYAELERGNLDLISSQTNESREKTSIPIRYCLYKGLLGVRVGMGTPEVVRQLDQITTWEQLKTVSLGQVFDWPDFAIQSEAGLRVLRLPDLNSSINRMKLGIFQLMPLGVVEVGPVAKRNQLSTISSWAIAYPTAYYFFVSKTRPDIAERLQYGFELALKDHSFSSCSSSVSARWLPRQAWKSARFFISKTPLCPQRLH